METVYDYIKYYKNLSFEESGFNDMDNIVFCTLSYLPLNNIIQETPLSIIPSKIKYVNETSIAEKSLKLLNEIYNSKRYENIKLSNYINIVDQRTQFSALTIRFSKRNCYVVYRGTDTSIIGWKEDFELAYIYPVPAQILAAKYLKSTLKITDKKVYVGGHSKGGNLAMSAAMEIDIKTFKKIKTIYNNDGPGFLPNEINSSKYQRMKTKLKMFIPEESMIGILLENTNDYIVVKSKANGFKAHDLTTWVCFGGFLKTGRQSKFSKELQRKLNSWLKNEHNHKKEIIVENLFKIIQSTGIKDIKELKFPAVKKLINEAKEIDGESKKNIVKYIN